jgi:hypothetical protein
MRRSANLGLATAAIGLLILIVGLRNAVAGGGPCTGQGSGAEFWCSGSCPGGDRCVEGELPDPTGRGVLVLCACMSKGGGPYTPVDAPTCALGRWKYADSTFYRCVNQGCKSGCVFDDPNCDHGEWSCPCGK